MAKIIGNTTATPNPRPDWNQTDETKADYIKNKPTLVDKFSEDEDGNLLYDGNVIGIGEVSGSGLTEEQATDLAANTEARHEHANKVNVLDLLQLDRDQLHLLFAGYGTVAYTSDVPDPIPANDINNYFGAGNPIRSGFIDRSAAMELIDQVNARFATKELVEGLGSPLRIELVEALPEIGEEGVIYLVPSEQAEFNVYKEYLFVNGSFELIGSTQIDLTGYAKTGDIAPAVNSALAEAKASGEFDGVDGKDGISGQDGADGLSAYQIWLNAGNTGTEADFLASLKGSDGDDGQDGTSVTIASVSESTEDGGSNIVTFSDGNTVTVKNGSKGDTGSAGKDGVSATHSWNGTTLTITSASGTSSANLKGETGANGSNGADGVGIKSVVQTTTSSADGGSNVITVTKTDNTTSTFTVKNGSKGSKGDKGDTGAAGKDGSDYVLTEADKAEIVAMVIESLGGNPVFGYVDKNNNIIVSGNLADGSYNVKYEMEDGSTVDIGDLVLDSNVYYSVTNTLTNCTNSNSATRVVEGESYSATITAKSGYELKTVTVTMGGSPVTVSGGNINIASVTDNIVITAVAEEAVVEIVNQIPLSTDESGNLFNGGQGWKTGYRISGSSGNESAQTGTEVTGFIPVDGNSIIYFKNIVDDGTHVIGIYGSNRTKLVTLALSNIGTFDGGVISIAVDSSQFRGIGLVAADAAFMRISANEITNESIITINQPIN